MSTTTITAVPEWLETPEHEATQYFLLLEGVDGDQDHNVALSRGEFDSLKRHLAKMRGYEIEAEVEQAAPQEAAAAKPLPATLEVIISRLQATAETLNSRVESLRRHPHADDKQLAGDVLLLNQIVSEWDGGNCVDIYPDESSLLATIRTICEL